MQIFTYTNLRGQSVTFGNGPPYVFERAQGMGAVELEIAKSAGAYQQGNTIHRLQREPRKVTLDFHVDGRPYLKSMYQYRQELLGVLSPRHALEEDTGQYARLVYTNDHGSWWTWAVPDSAKFEKRLTQLMVSCPVVFRCPSPFWFAMAQDTMTLEMSTDAFRLPFRLSLRLGNQRFAGTVNNASQTDTPVTVEINGTGEMPTLTNLTTGARIAVALPVPSGAMLRVKTDPEDLSVALRLADGSEQNAYGYLSLDSALSEFVLRPGLNNLEYQPSQPSQQSRVRLLWYPRMEGV